MDDEEMLRKLARQMLERMGYALETVKDGAEAIETYKKQKDSGTPFDAVILDLTIKGGMGGEPTMQQLLKIDPDVKAIVSSGYFNDPVMSDFEKYGFMGALSKPYEKKALKEALERLSE
ncbi:MAG: response regulator [Deltaproteobacteria bacterium]|nr:response regulator [Deltaproteobacteria bacterium]